MPMASDEPEKARAYDLRKAKEPKPTFEDECAARAKAFRERENMMAKLRRQALKDRHR